MPAAFFIGSAFIDNRELSYDHKMSLIVAHLNKNLSSDTLQKIEGIIRKSGFEPLDIVSGILQIGYNRRVIIDDIAKVLCIDFDEYLKNNSPYLSSESIEQLIKMGFSIGAHSVDHPNYKYLTLEEQVKQTEDSVKIIREKFDLDYGLFAFPHGDGGVTKKFFEKISEERLIDVSFGTNGFMKDKIRYNLQRLSFEKPLMPGEALLKSEVARQVYKKLLSNRVIYRE